MMRRNMLRLYKNSRMKTLCFRWLLLWLCPALVFAQNPINTPSQRPLQRPLLTLSTLEQIGDPLTLDEVMTGAVSRNYQIQIARVQEQLSRNDRTLGNAGFLPLLTADALVNRFGQNLRQDFFSSLQPPQRVFGAINRTSQTGLNLTAPLFNGFGTWITLDRLGELVRLAEVSTRANMEQTIADAMTGYYDVIRQLQRLIAFRQALDISRDRLELARANYEVGTRSKVDFLTAQVDYNTDSASLVIQEQSLRNAKILLNTLLVRDPLTEFAVRDTIIARTDLNYEQLRETVASNNPLLARAVLNRRVAALDTRLARAQQYPTVAFVAGYNFNTVDNEAGFGVQRARNDILTTSVRISAPIFNGFNLKRQIQNARANELIAEYQQADQRVVLGQALGQTFTQYQNSLILLNLQVQNYKISIENVSIAYDRYRVGLSTSVEFRDVQRNAVQVQTSLIDAAFNAKSAEIELLRLSSTIAPGK
jgi:outer membrane protein